MKKIMTRRYNTPLFLGILSGIISFSFWNIENIYSFIPGGVAFALALCCTPAIMQGWPFSMYRLLCVCVVITAGWIVAFFATIYAYLFLASIVGNKYIPLDITAVFTGIMVGGVIGGLSVKIACAVIVPLKQNKKLIKWILTASMLSAGVVTAFLIPFEENDWSRYFLTFWQVSVLITFAVYLDKHANPPA